MRLAWLLVWCALSLPALALDPKEMLDDPALEARARVLDHEIRCVQCQSEAVASSNGAWAQDARKMIRERIQAGDSNAEVKAFFVERYGEFVLMDPPKTGSTLLLWFSGPIMGLIALGVAFGFLRGRTKAAGPNALTREEEERLKDIIGRSD